MTKDAQPLRRRAMLPTDPDQCLRCDRWFPSTGTHHRLCDPCRHTKVVQDTETDESQWMSPKTLRRLRQRELVQEIGATLWGE